jgi:diguanylate cyclase (GGDEF)-like protein
MRPDVTRSILSEIDNAIAEHIDWLQRWHRAVLCGLPLDRDVVSEHAHLLCRFGAWYEMNSARGLVDQPAFQSLDQVHRELHDYGRWLAFKARGGQQIDTRDYDPLVVRTNTFNERARRIVAAFRTALSELDPLTGVYNRQRMLSELERERERAVRTHTPCTIAIADLDHFKRINDGYGHVTGDRVLFSAASCMLGQLRPYDTVFRFGGEEFLFCLPSANAAVGQTILNRLRQALAASPVTRDGADHITVTVSVGLAEITADATVGEVIERADEALYAAKRQGRNRVVVWRPIAPAAEPVRAVAHG